MSQDETKAGSELSGGLGADACDGLGIVGDGEPATIICCGKHTDKPSPTTDGDYCDCGTPEPLEGEYGFCAYGLGGFMRCPACCKVWNFVEDPG